MTGATCQYGWNQLGQGVSIYGRRHTTQGITLMTHKFNLYTDCIMNYKFLKTIFV